MLVHTIGLFVFFRGYGIKSGILSQKLIFQVFFAKRNVFDRSQNLVHDRLQSFSNTYTKLKKFDELGAQMKHYKLIKKTFEIPKSS